MLNPPKRPHRHELKKAAAQAEPRAPTPPVIKTLQPLQRGTLRWLVEYGPALVAVRYRADRAQGRRVTTVEVIVDEGALQSRARTTFRQRR
jgi:hypothetical protein